LPGVPCGETIALDVLFNQKPHTKLHAFKKGIRADFNYQAEIIDQYTELVTYGESRMETFEASYMTSRGVNTHPQTKRS